MSDLAYPIGKFIWSGSSSAAERARRIDEIAAAPAALRKAVAGLAEEQVETPYRPDGWTIRQGVHHVPDSHMNAYVRFKLAMTEDAPTIKPYDEAAWAELADTKAVPLETSLVLLEAVHERWVALLRSFKDADWIRTFKHPDLGLVPLEKNLAIYAWHGRHHVAHVTALRERMGWG